MQRIYGGARRGLTPAAAEAGHSSSTELGFGDLPVCMAKTQYSLSDDPDAAGRARGLHRHRAEPEGQSAGAGFIVALTGDIMTMPGLPKVPAAEQIDVDEDGRITGLF